MTYFFVISGIYDTHLMRKVSFSIESKYAQFYALMCCQLNLFSSRQPAGGVHTGGASASLVTTSESADFTPGHLRPYLNEIEALSVIKVSLDV